MFGGIINVVKSFWGLVTKNSTTILTGAAVTGVATTFILAIRETPKAMGLIDEAIYLQYEESGAIEDFFDWVKNDEGTYSWKDRSRFLTKREMIALTWKSYLPALGTGLITVGCIIGANHISSRRNAMLVSLYSLTETAFKEYQEKVVETIGRNKEIAVRDEIAGDHIRANPVSKNDIILTGKGEVLCYDTMSGRYFKSNVDRIKRVENDLNRDLRSEMFMTLNEFYEQLGLDHIALGEGVGWNIDKGYLKIVFSAQVSDTDEPCIVLNYDVVPK
jgi:hypothetical protein